MRNLIFGLLAVAGVIGLLALMFPGQFALLGESGWARITYLLCVLLLVASPMAGMTGRNRAPGDPGLFTSALIWVSLFVVLVVLYRASWIWDGVSELFREPSR